MILVRTFRTCSILQPVFHEPVRNLEKHVETFQDASKMVDLIGSATNAEPRYSYDEIYLVLVMIHKAYTRVRSVQIPVAF